MPEETQVTVFEITGEEITGGMDESHNQRFYDRIRRFEGHALKIGKTLGMSSVSLGVANEEVETIGFRFAESSGERYDVKGVEAEGKLEPEQMINRLR